MKLKWFSCGLGAAAAALLAACAPALDWRDVVEPELALQAQFPCKPQRVVQSQLGLLQCEAQGLRFLLAWRRFDTPAAAREAVGQGAAHTARGLAAQLTALPLVQLPSGAVDWQGTGRFTLKEGQRPGWIQVWARGLVFHQAMVLGPPSSSDGDGEPARLFFDSLRVKP
jgi:hypothetical protein